MGQGPGPVPDIVMIAPRKEPIAASAVAGRTRPQNRLDLRNSPPSRDPEPEGDPRRLKYIVRRLVPASQV
jgi:hypothetical protein